MYDQLEKSKENKSRGIAIAQKSSSVNKAIGFVDNRPRAVKQRVVNNRTRNLLHTKQLQGEIVGTNEPEFTKNSNNVTRQNNGVNTKQRMSSNVGVYSNGNGVVQCLLRTHETNSDEGTFLDEASGGKGFINSYTDNLRVDSSVLVEGEPKGKNGLIKTLKEAEVDGTDIETKLAQSLLNSHSWRPSNAGLKRELVDYVFDKEFIDQNVDTLLEEGDCTIDDVINDWVTDSRESIISWIKETADIGQASTVGHIATAASKMPIEWHDDLSYLVYEATRNLYTGQILESYTAPFVALISDIRNGDITKFKYVEKYGNEGRGTLGAEFTVEEPTYKKDEYLNKAVLHTHYVATDKTPNYGHTKPYEKRTARGFGWTEVNIDKITNVNDSHKKYDDL